MIERTLAIIKPDAVAAGHIGDIIRRIEREKFRIRGMKLLRLTKAQAEGFYAVHRDKPFFESLTTFMSSGPCVVLLLEGESAIARWRDVMGATDPARAAEGTIRKQFGTTIERNAVHGSDAPETAAFETAYFFNALETIG
ncbi:MAG TPA: nucleoside-diphosphate kinase [Blastocatellia bacterium]|nr:nucleoside-diphosphate kinase [Blastocatellia bacterium]